MSQKNINQLVQIGHNFSDSSGTRNILGLHLTTSERKALKKVDVNGLKSFEASSKARKFEGRASMKIEA
jgi:hypothetical protein